MLVIEPATRKRVRVNGHAELLPEGGLLLRVAEVFGNCQKYIQAREWGEAEPGAAVSRQQTDALTASQREWIARADTCFIASTHPEGGVDASHRGGQPGFVSVLDDGRLVLPDYAGNTMFQTLGNLASNAHAGLLFVDFESGSTLQLTGRAEIIWDAARIAPYPGAERLVEFTVAQVRETRSATPLRGRLLDYSPFNPS
jgi:predicted pyridoxine 5'-phosphate oxidase superfamily flavin-nucleotide-binding protein